MDNVFKEPSATDYGRRVVYQRPRRKKTDEEILSGMLISMAIGGAKYGAIYNDWEVCDETIKLDRYLRKLLKKAKKGKKITAEEWKKAETLAECW